MALKCLGDAGEASGPDLPRSRPGRAQGHANSRRRGVVPTTELAKLFVSLKKTNGWDGLVELIYNGAGGVQRLRPVRPLRAHAASRSTNCPEYEPSAGSGRLLARTSPVRNASETPSSAGSAALSGVAERTRPKRNAAAPAAGTRRPAAGTRRPESARPAHAGSAKAKTLGAAKTGRQRPAGPPRLPPGPMRNRGGIQGVASSPVLVGAVTVLVVIVAVFLAYNANNGLPFVSTYNLKARVPNADALVKGNEVRIGGVAGRRRQVGRPGAARRTAGSPPNSTSASTRAPNRCRSTRR